MIASRKPRNSPDGGVTRSRQNESIAIILPCDPGSAGVARRELEPFRALVGKTRFGDLRLLVSGLVVEAVGALGGAEGETMSLRVQCNGERVRATVQVEGDACFVLSTSPKPGELEWSGYLLQQLSDSRGVRRDRDSTTAWLEMSRFDPG
jgi:hypothetical protein